MSFDSIKKLGCAIDFERSKIKIKKKSFLLKTSYLLNIKPNQTIVVDVKSNIPKPFRNKSFIGSPFSKYRAHLTSNFFLKFCSNHAKIWITNTLDKILKIPANSVIGYVDIRPGKSFAAQAYHIDYDVNTDLLFCTQKDCDHVQTGDCHTSLDKSSDFAFGVDPEKYKRYLTFDQDNMTPVEIRKLQLHTFPHLNDDDVRLDMTDRAIIDRELDLETDTLLQTQADKKEVRLFFYDHRD